MDTKYMHRKKQKKLPNKNVCRHTLLDKFTKEEFVMLKLLAKVAEKYAKATNTASYILGWLHQPTMPASLIKKD